jgi:hypothetical protein
VKLSFAVATFVAAVSVEAASAQTLVGFAKLPADSFAPGPTSGNQIVNAAGLNGRTPPFVDKQPIQGFSAVLRAANGDYWAMPDNGFGQQINSADYVLRLYRISPDLKTRHGGAGTIAVETFITLHDPDRRIPFPIMAEQPLYPGTVVPVDDEIRTGRLLTGADFDIESVRQAHDGTLWFGDEFGPFLLHTDATGKVLEAPVQLPGVQSPQNPSLGGGAATLPRSKGFEGMAIAPNGRTLYPMLEGALIADTNQRRLLISEFDVKLGDYTGRQWQYRLESAANAIGDLTAVNDRLFIVIERDNAEGNAARVKKLYLIDLDDVDGSGFVVKHPLADLLDIDDPYNLGGFGPTFRFPFQTIESVLPLSQNELVILNDNNYPFSAGRVPGQPDPDELIVIRLDRPLTQYAK